jgi:HopA1 effector protein family
MDGESRARLAELLDSTRILSSRTFEFAGAGPQCARSHLTEYPYERGDDALVASLADVLYERCYCRDPRCRNAVSGRDATTITEALSAANPTADGWDRGWTVEDTDEGGDLLVRKGDRTRLAREGDYAPTAPVEPGSRVDLRRPGEDAGLQPAFFHVFGAALGDRYDDFVSVRVYLNCSAAAAPVVLREVAGALNRYSVPFSMKLLKRSEGYDRLDSCVLYVGRRHLAFVVALLLDLLPRLPSLDAATPLFTKAIAPGIAIADSPPGGASFGGDRMRLVAQGIVDAWRAGSQSVTDRLDASRRRFEEAGLDFDRPWLAAGNVDLPITPAEVRAV